jgi:hypothetical protein
MAQKQRKPKPMKVQVLRSRGAQLLRKTKGVKVPSLRKFTARKR